MNGQISNQVPVTTCTAETPSAVETSVTSEPVALARWEGEGGAIASEAPESRAEDEARDC